MTDSRNETEETEEAVRGRIKAMVDRYMGGALRRQSVSPRLNALEAAVVGSVMRAEGAREAEVTEALRRHLRAAELWERRAARREEQDAQAWRDRCEGREWDAAEERGGR